MSLKLVLFSTLLLGSSVEATSGKSKRLRHAQNNSGSQLARSESIHMDISRVDAFELDKHEVLLRLSLCLFLLLAVIASFTVSISLSYNGCLRLKKGHKKRITKQYVAKVKPRKFMQSFGEAETDVETVIASPHSLASTLN